MPPRFRGLVLVLLTVAAVSRAQEFEIVRHFMPYTAGTGPSARMVVASDGNVYGTTVGGGELGLGTIFRLVPDGQGGFDRETLHSFYGPDGAFPYQLIQGSDSRLYGVTQLGGALDGGVVYVLEPDGSLFVLHSFAPTDFRYLGASGLTQASDGQLYGVYFHGGASNLGMIFRLSTSGDFAILHDFVSADGQWPYGALLQASDGYLYGTTTFGGGSAASGIGFSDGEPAVARPKGIGVSGSGTFFRIDLAGNFTVLHRFDSAEAGLPNGDLVEGFDGNLYGTAFNGGTAGVGTIYRCDKSGNTTVLLSFSGPDGAYPFSGLTRGPDGTLYGATTAGGASDGGSAFGIAEDGTYTLLASFPIGHSADPRDPKAGLVPAPDGSLLGNTFYGGPSGTGGTVFRVLPPATGFTVVHAFDSSLTALSPTSALVQTPDGNFWGTAQGGSLDVGSVFRLSGGAPVLVHEFLGPDGVGPKDLVLGSDGNLYGTASGQGPNGGGTVFRLDLSGAFATLHGFAGSDGADPEAGLIEATDGNFYGTTSSGGASAEEMLFRMDTSGAVTTVLDFGNPSGSKARLLQASDGNLYGTTSLGGDFGAGAVFRSGLSGGPSTLRSLSGTTAKSPLAALIQASDGDFYGTASAGGTGARGTLFRIDGSGTFSVIHAFTTGGFPRTPLLQASDGRLYGTTSDSFGSVFRIDPSGENFETLHDFRRPMVRAPYPDCSRPSDGMLYGSASGGGYAGRGLVYRIDLANSPPSVDSISPTSGRAAGGVFVAVAGDHFRLGIATSLAFPFVFNTHVLLALTPPANPGSLVDVTVTNVGRPVGHAPRRLLRRLSRCRRRTTGFMP